jgi:hypothetical protein
LEAGNGPSRALSKRCEPDQEIVFMRPTAPILASLALAALAGCATPPQQVVDQGRRYEFASGISPQRLIFCTTQNARFSRYTADWSELVRPNTYESVVSRTGNFATAYAYEPIIIARTSPAPQGSQLVLYFAGDLRGDSEQDWIERLNRGCDIPPSRAAVTPVVPAVLPVAPVPSPAPAPAKPVGRETRG